MRTRGCRIFTAATLLALLLAFSQTAFAADLVSPRRPHAAYHHAIVLPPERHVIERVHPPFGGDFLINGTVFAPASPACLGWAAGEPIRLVAGDWHAQCVTAVFYNVTRHQSCEMLCKGGTPWWW
jgi:hypothetical protein